MENYSQVNSQSAPMEIETSQVTIAPQAGQDSAGNSFYQNFLGNAAFLGKCLNNNNYQPLKRRGDGDIGAGHVGKYISLANPDRASKFSCHIPAILTYGPMVALAIIYWMSPDSFFSLWIMISLYVVGWCFYMVMCSLGAVHSMRKFSDINHTEQLDAYVRENPQALSGMLHFVLLPNYAEDLEMLAQSIQVFTQWKYAREYMVIVLAMEAREGEEGQKKAKDLINRYKHLFKAIFATYHPSSIPGEVKGKSSNTQWAFRDVQKWYGSYVSQNQDVNHDTSKVFITISDADSIFQREYFSALTLNAIQNRSVEDRSWLVWQPPILNMRNIETVPGPVRCSGYGSFLFESAGLYSSSVFDHLCFSTYTLTLALANHPIVDGWDTDVIAEDHHMFLKCLFASYWEELFSNETNRSVKNISKLRIQPIWCPVTSYLAEVENSYFGSMYARYLQGRRHLQGIAELSYICLQHYNVVMNSREKLPWRAHLQMFHLALKYATVSIINHVYQAGLLCLLIASIGYILTMFVRGEITNAVADFYDARQDQPIFDSVVLLCQWYSPIFSVLCASCSWAITKDTMEGRYCPVYLQNTDENFVGIHYESDDQVSLVKDSHGALKEIESGTSSPLPAHLSPKPISAFANREKTETIGRAIAGTSTVTSTDIKLSSTSLSKLNGALNGVAPSKGEVVVRKRKMSMWSEVKLFCKVYMDFNLMGTIALFFFGVLPVFLQTISLSRFGHKFDYVVAGKPALKSNAQSDNSSVSTKTGSMGSTSASSSDVELEKE